ncbi:MAG: MnhB domain-containing protein [Pseudomonadota bacterium]
MSVLLQTATRFLVQIMLLLSILLVLRGHNFPGGGFIGALVATSAIGLYTLAFGLKATGFDRWSPRIIALGLLLLLISIACALFSGQAMLTGLWLNVAFLGNAVKLGTPLIFDFGIYFLIVGSLSWLIAELEDESS